MNIYQIVQLYNKWVILDDESGDPIGEAEVYEKAILFREIMERAYDDVFGSLVSANLLVNDDLTPVEQEYMRSSDAKLKAAQRKRLKKGTFCGPDRSFPVPDCAHVVAAFRLLNRAKVSSATRAKIRSCVSAKNKAMGCGVKSGKDEEEQEEPASKVLLDKRQGHSHTAVLDSEGSGVSSWGDAHEHRIINLFVSFVHGHTHKVSEIISETP